MNKSGAKASSDMKSPQTEETDLICSYEPGAQVAQEFVTTAATIV
jgi:hypothetical protein